MRYIGALALAAAAVMTSVCMNLRKKRRVKLFYELSDFFTALAVLSETAPRDAAEAVRRLASARRFGLLRFLLPFAQRCADADVRRVWREEIAASSAGALLKAEEAELLNGFADHFGVTSLAAFTDACRKYADAFAACRDREKKNYEQTGRLTVGAGVLAAVLMGIAFM